MAGSGAASASAAHGGSHEHPHVALYFLFVALVLGVAARGLLKRTPVPYTVALLVVGLALGGLDEGTDLGEMSKSLRMWRGMDPHLLLGAFLPVLVFESAFSLDWHTFHKCATQVLLLAGPGVLAGTALLGLVVHEMLPFGWGWSFSFMCGSILCATDPVAVVALLKDVGASKRLGHIIEGESLVNDGTAIVLFTLFLELASGESKTAGDITVFFIWVPIGSALIGTAFALGSLLWLNAIVGDGPGSISITIFAAYLCFLTAEFEANTSGVLAVVVQGVLMSAFGGGIFTGEAKHALHVFWDMAVFVANTVLFILTGVIIAAEVSAETGGSHTLEASDFGWALAIYVAVVAVRAVIVGIFYPLLRRFGYGLSAADAAVVWWGGLRGAVGLALALSVQDEAEASASSDDASFDILAGTRVLLLTGTVVVLTLVVNGTTTGALLRGLGLTKPRASAAAAVRMAWKSICEKCMNAYYLQLGADDVMGSPDFRTVMGYLPFLRGSHNDEAGLVSRAPCSEEDLLREARRRLLGRLKTLYVAALDESRVDGVVAAALVEAADQALDAVDGGAAVGVTWGALRVMLGVDAGSTGSQRQLSAQNRLLRGARTGRLAEFVPDQLKTLARIRRRALVGAAVFHDTMVRAREEVLADDALEGGAVSPTAAVVASEAAKAASEAACFLRHTREDEPELSSAVKSEECTWVLLRVAEEARTAALHSGLVVESECAVITRELERARHRLTMHPPKPKYRRPQALLRALPILDPTSPYVLRDAATRDAVVRSAVMNVTTPTKHIAPPGPGVLMLLAQGVVELRWKSPFLGNGAMRIGAVSTSFGWALGAHFLMVDKEAADMELELVVLSPVTSFEIRDRGLVEKILAETQAATGLWRAACSVLLSTTLASELEVPVATAETAASKGTVSELAPGTEVQLPPLDSCDELVVLLRGSLYAPDVGTCRAPTVLSPAPHAAKANGLRFDARDGHLVRRRNDADLQTHDDALRVSSTDSAVLLRAPLATGKGGDPAVHSPRVVVNSTKQEIDRLPFTPGGMRPAGVETSFAAAGPVAYDHAMTMDVGTRERVLRNLSLARGDGTPTLAMVGEGRPSLDGRPTSSSRSLEPAARAVLARNLSLAMATGGGLEGDVEAPSRDPRVVHTHSFRATQTADLHSVTLEIAEQAEQPSSPTGRSRG